MSFLKKLGDIIVKGAGVFLGFAPAITAAVPSSGGLVTTISKDISEIANLVVIAETVGQQQNIPGPDRAKMIASQVVQILLDTILKGQKIQDQPLLIEAGADIAGGFAKALTSVHEDATNSVVTTVHT